MQVTASASGSHSGASLPSSTILTSGFMLLGGATCADCSAGAAGADTAATATTYHQIYSYTFQSQNIDRYWIILNSVNNRVHYNYVVMMVVMTVVVMTLITSSRNCRVLAMIQQCFNLLLFLLFLYSHLSFRLSC